MNSQPFSNSSWETSPKNTAGWPQLSIPTELGLTVACKASSPVGTIAGPNSPSSYSDINSNEYTIPWVESMVYQMSFTSWTSGHVAGTPWAMAPEIRTGSPLDALGIWNLVVYHQVLSRAWLRLWTPPSAFHRLPGSCIANIGLSKETHQEAQPSNKPRTHIECLKQMQSMTNRVSLPATFRPEFTA